MTVRLRKLVKWPALGLLLVVLGLSSDAFRLRVAQEVATPYLYDLIEWEAANFFDKWIHRLSRALPWKSLSQEERHQRVQEYFRLGEELGRLQHELTLAAARTSEEARLRVMMLETERDKARSQRNKLRDDVEEAIEAAISSVVSDAGLGTLKDFLFPPVDIRLSRPPKLLVTSPRDHIRRIDTVLLDSDVTIGQRERVEDELFEDSNLAALVLNIGGVATYPASIPANWPLQRTLRISAHEWLHHYLFFRPLGFNINKNTNMLILNETVADIAGDEIGDQAFEMLGGTIERPSPRDTGEAMMPQRTIQENGREFDFDMKMRKTRLRVDELLAQGRIEETEAYMEERRQLFVENGFFIRKLNQAFFAFNGTYADNPASVSPIGGQLQEEFRLLMPDVSAVFKEMSRVGSYQEFLEKRREPRPEASR